MPTTAREIQGSVLPPALHLAFELRAKKWKLGFTTGLGRAPRIRVVGALDLAALQKEIRHAKGRLGVAADGQVVSCYGAGRDGFRLHLWLLSQGIDKHVVDSSSIEVNRLKRRRKTDQLNLRSLLRLLARWIAGEEDIWRILHVPPVEAEDRRHLHRELEGLTHERTERTNRILGLLATQGVQLKLTKDFAR